MYTIFFDGACFPNPGECAYGVSLQKNGIEIDCTSCKVGRGTNNKAEYHGLIGAIQMATAHSIKSCKIMSDSLLIVNQMNKTWVTKDSDLQLLQNVARSMIENSDCDFTLIHIKRHFNTRADNLAKTALSNKERE